MTLSYDANGNIQKLNRKGGANAAGVGTDMDDLTYNYIAGTNKLQYVQDNVAATAYPNDIDNQVAYNYSYDQIGNMISDQQSGLTINWNVYKKITSIAYGNKPTETFGYDAMGNRVKKDTGTAKIYYVRDAHGSILATYKLQSPFGITRLSQYLYGSARLGEYYDTLNLNSATLSTVSFTRKRGWRHYELSNHLGNVQVVVSDRKVAIRKATVDSVAYYTADIISATDYYAFGATEPDRQYNSGNYRFGFNGKENDNEVKGQGNELDFGARIYDTRLSRWMSVDPMSNNYPDVSPYVFGLNTPIQAKDPDGKVVIFINGMHTGSGGTASYWEGYDDKVMNAIDDHSARYVDGALGGSKALEDLALKAYTDMPPIIDFLLTGGDNGQMEKLRLSRTAAAVLDKSSVNRKVREQAGYAQGVKDAQSIFDNLTEGESIKLVTHSMGTAFSRGYAKAIQEYIKTHNITDHKLELVVDINAFQGGELNAVPGAINLNKTGGLDGMSIIENILNRILGQKVPMSVPTVDKVKGSKDITTKEEMTQGHDIKDKNTQGIKSVGNAGKASKKPIEQGSNNANAPK